MDMFRQRTTDATEAGGILLGRLLVHTNDVVVDKASPPAQEDRRSRFAFWRARRPAQRRVNVAWITSTGTEQYLGEWHSHPEPDPSPSPKDIREWRRVLRRTLQAPSELFFVIVGQSVIRVWEGSEKGREICELRLRPGEQDSTG